MCMKNLKNGIKRVFTLGNTPSFLSHLGQQIRSRFYLKNASLNVLDIGAEAGRFLTRRTHYVSDGEQLTDNFRT